MLPRFSSSSDSSSSGSDYDEEIVNTPSFMRISGPSRFTRRAAPAPASTDDDDDDDHDGLRPAPIEHELSAAKGKRKVTLRTPVASAPTAKKPKIRGARRMARSTARTPIRRSAPATTTKGSSKKVPVRGAARDYTCDSCVGRLGKSAAACFDQLGVDSGRCFACAVGNHKCAPL
ncbi:uncharacterized protein BCR38DRAFT_444946 [Pseudomassariella vexata]|uniref:Uncharacterized protein n=1 Tax=Pseudomassariella vexata TaxID=1141098 RepID=A0A1Y2DK82_9PEZI|nr:uncharacterized protein BCR38DRAFT_444946 [Pseudomassariella vexata]ORY59574.1 hypothetical protein BCR38DRAFT_444946 [Pseudomassariella vexata]